MTPTREEVQAMIDASGPGNGANIKSGVVYLASNGEAEVTFTTPFTTLPLVVATSNFRTTDTSTTLCCYNQSLTGFIIKGAGNTAGLVAWIATSAGNV